MENNIDNKFAGFIPSCLITLIPSTKNTRINTAGNAIIQPTAIISIMINIPITKSCTASHSAYSDKVKNRKTARHIIMNKNAAPLRNVLDSCSIIPANTQIETKNTKNANRHITAPILQKG
jgi:hypothetical protein